MNHRVHPIVARQFPRLASRLSPPGKFPRTRPPAQRVAPLTTMGLVVWGQELLQSWGVTPKDDRKPRPETCVFCAKIAARVADPASDDAFVHVDDDLVVFRDWKPAARRHYLVCPRAHVSSARALTPADARLARRMLELGARAIARDFPDDPPETRFGFHIPPFNSVDHLHMHAFALPFEPAWKERKYSEEAWARFAFQPAEELVERLEAEGRKTEGGEGEGNGERGGCSGGEGEGNGETGGVSSAKL